LFPINDMENQ